MEVINVYMVFYEILIKKVTFIIASSLAYRSMHGE
jgi:hypothetical protein